MYGGHRHHVDFGTAITWGVGLAIGWYIGGLLIGLSWLALGFLWGLSSAFQPMLRYITRAILIAIVLAAILFLLVIAFGDM